MSNIGSITGVVSAVCYVPLVAKYPLRKLNMNKAKMQRHLWYSLFLTAAIACHISMI